MKGITKTIENEAKEQKGGLLGMLLGTLGASLLGNNLSGKRNIKSWLWIEKISISRHPLTNIEIQKYCQNESRFNEVYSRDNLPKKIKNGACVINLDEYADVETHWIALYALNNDITYFDSFGVEHVPKEVKKSIGNKNLQTNIFKIQANSSIMCGYFCIGFVDFMLAGKLQLIILVCFHLMI